MPNVYPAEVREKAVRLVLEHRGDYASEYEAIRTIAERMSLKTEAVRVWAPRPKRPVVAPVRRRRPRRRSNCGHCAGRTRSSEDHRNTQSRNVFLRAGVRPATQMICRFIAEHREEFFGRIDLPCAHRARVLDRPENLLRLAEPSAVETRLVGRQRYGGSGRNRQDGTAGAGCTHERAAPRMRWGRHRPGGRWSGAT